MAQASLFGTPGAPAGARRLALPDAEFWWYEDAFSTSEADRYFERFRSDTPWRQDDILIHGKRIPLPRLQAWYADADLPLAYSGLRVSPLPMTPSIHAIRRRVQALCDLEFNGVLITLYRDGNDSVGWHSDDEPQFGADPVIASVSLGETRDFVLKHRDRADLSPFHCALSHGSLLVMGRGSQTRWAHQLPKRRKVSRARINLTLRQVARG